MRSIIIIAHNLRSAHNIGSLLRTAEGLGVERVYLTGYTPYPLSDGDVRLPHLAQKIDKQIAKTALGAERSLSWQYTPEIAPLLTELKSAGYQIAALEQAPGSVSLPGFTPSERVAIILGREVEGIEKEVLAQCDLALEIPMLGSKESYNVVQAAAMCLYHIRFAP